MTTSEAMTSSDLTRSVLRRWAAVLVLLTCAMLYATWRMASAASRLPATSILAAGDTEPDIEHWTCSMHPEVRQPNPGNCPECSMELIPKYVGVDAPGVMPAMSQGAGHEPKTHAPSASKKAHYRCTMPECGDQGSGDPNSRCPVCGMKRGEVFEDTGDAGLTGELEIRLSDRARRLAELDTEPVMRRRLSTRLRTVGKIGYDETRHKMVSAWIGGRIDKLFADFTGMVVRKDDHLVELYSPDLLSAQEEYLQAIRSSETTSGALESSRKRARQLVVSARRKLELLGISEDQMRKIENTRSPQTQMTIYAPIGGTVVRKSAMEGMYVRTGDVLYEIADLTHVWLMLDVYESDLPWILPGGDVRVTAESLPGETFDGKIVFVDPVVNEQTRTIGVRVNIANPRRKLKPGMFVSAEIVTHLNEHGRAAGHEAGGAFACPMHPWETSENLGICSLCEMDMVPRSQIVSDAGDGLPGAALCVPRSAVLQSGERALAYVEVEPGLYRGVELKIGPLAQTRSGRQFYPVLSGLEEDAEVVIRGNFVIDSQFQLSGKPSLFNARGFAAEHSHH